MPKAKKLIEVALPLEAINEASAREKSIRHGHPSTLHLWWARRPLAAARAVIFASLVDDPNDPDALPAFVEACNKLPVGTNVNINGDSPRMRLFDFIERLVTWEATTDEAILNTARELIQIATEGNPPPLLDPFAGGGSIPLEAQRLGLEAHASDLNPVAVMINKAQIEIPPRFANMPPVNPRERVGMFAPHSPAPHPLAPSPTRGEGEFGQGEGVTLASNSLTPFPTGGEGEYGQGEGATLAPHPLAPSPTGGEGEFGRIDVPRELEQTMREIARKLRREQTRSEEILWEALRKHQLEGRKFRRQQPVGAFVLGFYCAAERLAVEVDGAIHQSQREADAQRQEILESLGIRFVRVTADAVETDLPAVLSTIRAALLPSPLRGRGAGGEGPISEEFSHSAGSEGLSHSTGSEGLSHNAALLPSPLRGRGAGGEGQISEEFSHSAALLPSPPRGRGAGGEGQISEGLWRGASGLAADVRYYGEWMREKAWERIGHLYPLYTPLPPVGEGQGVRGETVIAWIWARTVKSPNPAVNVHVPLVRSFELSKKKGRRAWVEPVVESLTPDPSSMVGRGEKVTHRIRYVVRREQDGDVPPKQDEGTVNRRGGRCIVTDVPMPFEYIREEAKAGRMGATLMAIVTEGQNGRSYYSPTDEHIQSAENAIPEWKPVGDLPEMALGFRVQLYGMDEYSKLFTPRQLVALTTFSDLVAEAREQAYQDALAAGLSDDGIPLRDGGRGARAYAEAVSVYLAFAVDRLANRGATICVWNTTGEKIEQVFGRQAIPMTWDFPESNAFSNSSGNFIGQAEYLINSIEFLPAQGYAQSSQVDALQSNTTKLHVISTDPPYYDMVGYADLSDFFYIWMRRALRDVYPDIFGTVLVPKEPELIASPYRHGSKEAANAHFEGGMQQTFTNIRRFISPDYPLTVYYAFKQQDAKTDEDDPALNPSPTARSSRGEGLQNPPRSSSPSPHEVWERGSGGEGHRTSTGWETMLNSLINSGFSIDGTWPVRSERATGLKAAVNALASSIVLVCRPRAADAPTSSRRAFLDALRRELPAALKEMQSGNIAPVDLAQASIGPGMAIYSRYSAVLEADGSNMSVRTALGLINAALDEYLAEQDGDIDADTRFAVAWFEQYGFDEGEFGVADTLARAKNTAVSGVETAGLVIAARGKVRLIHWKEYDPGAWNPQQDKRPTVWEATHHLIERLNSHGETGSAKLMANMPPDMAAEARNLAYRLYSICERKGWAEHARDYNALVLSWAGIGEETARLREAAESGQATRQMGLFDN